MRLVLVVAKTRMSGRSIIYSLPLCSRAVIGACISGCGALGSHGFSVVFRSFLLQYDNAMPAHYVSCQLYP